MIKKVTLEDEIMDRLKNINDLKKDIDFISTGSLSLDLAIGGRGIPKGRFTEIFGHESSGKTTLALSICRKALEDGLRVLYIDAESALEETLINGILEEYSKDMDILVSNIMEEVFEVSEKSITDGKYDLIILDSIGNLGIKKIFNPKDDGYDVNITSGMIAARMITEFLKRNTTNIRNNNITYIGLNQVRDKIGGYFQMVDTTGGHAWKHVCSLRIRLSKQSDIKSKDDEIIGIYSKFVVVKNKISSPMRSSTFPIIFGKGIDFERDVIDVATNLGIITRRGPYYMFDDSSLGIGISNSINMLRNDRETLDRIIKMVYDRFSSIVAYSDKYNDGEEDILTEEI